MIYEALPIPSTNGIHWGVYATFRRTGLPPTLELRTKDQVEAQRYAEDFCAQRKQYPAISYTWRWIRIDDYINQWWKKNDWYAKKYHVRNLYREGGRVIIIDFGDGQEVFVNR